MEMRIPDRLLLSIWWKFSLQLKTAWEISVGMTHTWKHNTSIHMPRHYMHKHWITVTYTSAKPKYTPLHSDRARKSQRSAILPNLTATDGGIFLSVETPFRTPVTSRMPESVNLAYYRNFHIYEAWSTQPFQRWNRQPQKLDSVQIINCLLD